MRFFDGRETEDFSQKKDLLDSGNLSGAVFRTDRTTVLFDGMQFFLLQ